MERGNGVERSRNGMVAVIRGLQDAGLAVTLSNEGGNTRGSIYAPRTSSPSPPQTSLTQTASTNTRPQTRTQMNMRAQVCDDRHNSSYQSTHCNQRPPSPPVQSPQLPRKRPDGIRSQGPFGVGSQRSSIEAPSSLRAAAGSATPYRASFFLPERGTPTYDLRASEAFADSLRKYPSIERSPSAELISKLLSYTQHKNDAKTTKSLHSPTNKKPDREKRRYKDKDIQTYVRTRPKMDSSVKESKSKSFKRMRVHSPTKDSKEKRYKNNQLKDTYDYLKSTSPYLYNRTNRAIEVRYLSDMSKCIKDTIKQIVDETSSTSRPEAQVCSQMQNRYLQHRKRCQSRSNHGRNIEQGESSQADACELSVIPYDNADACVSTCPYKPPPCYCQIKRDSAEEFGRKVTEKIGKWLLDIPTYARMSDEDKDKRIEMAEDLASIITDLKDDENIEEKARMEIENCLDELPMWLPSNKAERDDFKTLLADNLMNKLTRVFEGTDQFDEEIEKWMEDIRFRCRDNFGEKVDRDKIADMFADRIKSLVVDRPENDDDYQDALKNEIIDILNELPIVIIGNRCREIEKLANKLVNNIKSIPASEVRQKQDKFGKAILKWIDDVDFKRKDSRGSIIDKEEIKADVVERLKYLAMDRPPDDDDYHEMLKNEIENILEDLPIEIPGNKRKGIERLAIKLADTLKKIPESDIRPIGDKFDEKIAQLMKNIKFKHRYSDGQLIDTRKFGNIFADRLKPLVINKPDDDEDYHEALKNEILDILEDLPIAVEEHKGKYIEKVAENITNVIKRIPAFEIKQKKDKFDDKISQWMKSINFKQKDSQGNIIDKEIIAETLAERLKSIALDRPDDGDEYLEALENEILDVLQDLPIECEGNKDKYLEKLATKLARSVKSIPASTIKPKLDKFDQKVSGWMNDIKLKRRDSQGEIVDREKILETFQERLKAIAINRPEDDEEYHELLINEAINMLEDLPIDIEGDKTKYIEKMAKKLVKSVKDVPQSEIKHKEDKLDRQIKKWMKDVKLKKLDSQGQFVDTDKISHMFRERIRSVTFDRPDTDEEYHEGLKTEATDILERIPIHIEDTKDVDKLAKKLAQTVKDIPTSEIRHKTDKFDDRISRWVNSIKLKKRNSRGEPIDKDEIGSNIKERMKAVAYYKPDDEEEYIEALKSETIDILSELPIEVDENIDKYVEREATKLANTLKDIPTTEVRHKSDKFDHKVSQVMRDVKLKKKDDQGNIIERRKVSSKVAKMMKPYALSRPKDDDEYSKVLKTEAVNVLDEVPIVDEGDKHKTIDELATKFATTLKDVPTSHIKQDVIKERETYNRNISSWLEDIPAFASISPLEKNKMIQSLAKRLKSKSPEDKEAYEQEITQWLTEEAAKKGIPFDSKTMTKMAHKLSSNISDAVQKQRQPPTHRKKRGPITKGRSEQDYEKECAKEIQDWLDDIPQFSGTKQEKAAMVDSLTKKLHELKEEGILDEDEIQDEIANWLDAEAKKKGIKMDAKTKNDLVAQLAQKIGNIKPPRRSSGEIEDETGTVIWDMLKNVPGVTDTAENWKMIDELANKMNTLRKDGGDNISDATIQKEVDDWLDNFIERSGANPKYKDKLEKDLTSKMKSILKPNAVHIETKQTINDEVSGILDKSSVKLSPTEKKNISRKVSSYLAKNLYNIGDDEQDQEEIRANIIKMIQQEADLSNEEAAELADSFIGSTKKISAAKKRALLQSDSPDDVKTLIHDKVKSIVGDLDIDNLEEVEATLTNLLTEQVLNGEDAELTTEKIMEVLQSANVSKKDAKDLAMRLASQALDFSSIRNDKESMSFEFTLDDRRMFETSAIHEISDFMEELMGAQMDPQTKRRMEAEAQNLAERLGDVLSDPNQSMADKEESINYEVFKFLKKFNVPEKYGNDLVNRLRSVVATSTPRASQQFSFYPRRASLGMEDELRRKIEENFIFDLEAAITDWILDLPIKIEDKALINTIAKDLASDIADRQKYLQSHPEVKLTAEEELEFLKYQVRVYRAMGKSVEANNLATIMTRTPNLLSVIKDVLIPMLAPYVNEAEVMNKLSDEISMWIDGISSELRDDIDFNKRQEIIKELAEKLRRGAKSNGYIDSEIANWLKPYLKDPNNANVQSMVDSLNSSLISKGIIRDLSLSGAAVRQNLSQFIEENLSTGIMDWLKSTPLYQRRNSGDKRIQENVMEDLARDVKLAIQRAGSETDLDMEVLKEVRKNIERLPMEPELQADKVFIDRTSAQLVDYLKNMHMFDDISGRLSDRPVEYLVTTVNDWLKSLPMNTKSLQTKEIDDLKMDFMTHLSEAVNDPDQNDQAVKNIIKEFIQKLPLDVKKANDPKFINHKVDVLFRNVLATPFAGPVSRPTINRQLVESAVQDWAEKLPLAPGNKPERVSDKIQKFTSEISDVLEDINTTAVDNYINTLHDKAKQFMKKMPIRSDNLTPKKLNYLAEDLVSTIKDKAADLSPRPNPNKNAADALHDYVTTWCEDLPLYEGTTKEEREKANALKHNLASKLMTKIGELNMDPEILNDDDLYEHLILEELNDLLSELPFTPEMEANIESIKENFMSKVREVRQKTQDELAGQNYKQKLRDTISRSLPFDCCISTEGGEPFEVLVDNLADAYVNINFITHNAEQKEAYKYKIAGEINRYCNHYLARHPEAPLDSIKLNQDLFRALKQIPVPDDDIMRSEAEHIRMKDEINDWMKELPLKSGSCSEALQNSKITTVLAKKLVDIEKEQELNPEIDYGDKTQKEIAKILKTLPMEPGHSRETDHMVQQLMHKVQSSERSRRIRSSTVRHSVDVGPLEFGASCTCSPKIKRKPICNRNICNYKPKIPSCTLSIEDRAHLERIRQRNRLCKTQQKCSCRDASVSPPPTDVASQTDVGVCPRIPISPRLSPCVPPPPCGPPPPCEPPPCQPSPPCFTRPPCVPPPPCANKPPCLPAPPCITKPPCIPSPPCVPSPACIRVPPSSSSEQEVSPQVIIKEYLWDSATSKLIGPVYRLPCLEMNTSSPSLPSLQRPCQRSISIQPSPCSILDRPCSSPRQTPPRPCMNVRAPCQDIATPRSTRPCWKKDLGASPCPSPHIFSTPPCAERAPCLTPPRPCFVSFGSSPCASPCQTPCPPRPCVDFGTSPHPSSIDITCTRPEIQRIPYPRPYNLGRSPCSSPHQMPSKSITLPRPVISSQPPPGNPIPCQEIPYCSTPRRHIPRDPNVPFRQPNFQNSPRTCSPGNRDCRSRGRPRVINVGDADSFHPCRRISEYKDKFRPRIYRSPSRESNTSDEGMRCWKCNHRIRNVCLRHRSPECPSNENVRHCSRCCGLPTCPHPMGMFFR